jgi:hypothetical protein
MTNSKPTPNQSQIRSSDITPPPELVQQWIQQSTTTECTASQVATRAAQWGADQELETCCEVLAEKCFEGQANLLRGWRRPEPPSLKEQALEALDRIDQLPTFQDMHIIRRALQELND